MHVTTRYNVPHQDCSPLHGTAVGPATPTNAEAIISRPQGVAKAGGREEAFTGLLRRQFGARSILLDPYGERRKANRLSIRRVMRRLLM